MKTDQVISFIAGLLSGSIVGAAVIILLAPQSGAETRRLITSKANAIVDAGKQAIAEKRQELRNQYETAIKIPLPAGDQNA
jgi:gas vesicle protein